MSRALRLIVVTLLCFSICGCQAYQSRYKNPLPTDNRAEFFWHTVAHQGETLGIIAKWYTGSFDNWKFIRDVNPKLDPHRITLGIKIRIPGKLLKTSSSMPRDFVAGYYNKKATGKVESKAVENPVVETVEETKAVESVAPSVAVPAVAEAPKAVATAIPQESASGVVGEDEIVALPSKTEIEDEQELVPFEDQKKAASPDAAIPAIPTSAVREEVAKTAEPVATSEKDKSLQKTREELLKELLSE